MTELFVVRSESVQVEDLVPGNRVILPNGRRVTVERLDTYDHGATLLVRWWRHAERGEPGHPGGKNLVDPIHKNSNDGRLLGSLMAYPPRHLVTVERAPATRPGASHV